MVEKPLSIASNPVKSAKWDEVTAGRDFEESDVPNLVLLCQWHAIVERAMEVWRSGMQAAMERPEP